MPSVLDERMDAALDGLTRGADAPLRVGQVAVDDLTLPVIATAPATLPPYFAHFCAEHRDAVFLVAGAERLTFAQRRQGAALLGLIGADGATRRRGSCSTWGS